MCYWSLRVEGKEIGSKKKSWKKKNGQKFDECHKFSDLRSLGNPDRLNSKDTS